MIEGMEKFNSGNAARVAEFIDRMLEANNGQYKFSSRKTIAVMKDPRQPELTNCCYCMEGLMLVAVTRDQLVWRNVRGKYVGKWTPRANRRDIGYNVVGEDWFQENFGVTSSGFFIPPSAPLDDGGKWSEIVCPPATPSLWHFSDASSSLGWRSFHDWMKTLRDHNLPGV